MEKVKERNRKGEGKKWKRREKRKEMDWKRKEMENSKE